MLQVTKASFNLSELLYNLFLTSAPRRSNYETLELFLKWAIPGIFFRLLSVFSWRRSKKMVEKLLWKMICQVPGIKIQTHNAVSP